MHDVQKDPASIDIQDLEKLARFSTPTICNAIEKFDVRPRNTGYMNSEILPLLPELGSVIGFAVTVTTTASHDIELPGSESRHEFWNYIYSYPRRPRILVIQDLDEPSMVGAYIGEVNANIHLSSGCVGAISNGATRDLNELRELPFPVWGKGVSVSHAYNQVVQYGVPVSVGGLMVKPGDLLLADLHGVVEIPLSTVKSLPEVAAEIESREQKIIKFCKSESFSIEGLVDIINQTQAAQKIKEPDYH